MSLNISKITRARNIFYTNNFSESDLKVQFGGKGLSVVEYLVVLVESNFGAILTTA